MAALELEKNLISIIQNGDIEGLKSLGLRSSEANRPLTITPSIKIHTPSHKCPFRMIQSPTIVVLAILCEQPKLLEFILETYKPNLDIRVNGWSPLHYACCTGSYACLQILLRYEFIQENIDQEVFTPGPSENSSNKTTALHIAVSNRRHAQALLLTDSLPQIIYGVNGEKLESPKDSEYLPCNIDQLSSHGNSPLHIAAKINDVDMVKILLFNGADTNIEDSHKMTALALAKSFDNVSICEAFNDADNIDIEALHDKYIAHEDKKEAENAAPKASEETDQSAKQENEAEEVVKRDEVRLLNEKIETLVSVVQQLNLRIQYLESRGQEKDFHICSRCGAITETKCPKCGEYYCQNCINKPPHDCQQNE